MSRRFLVAAALIVTSLSSWAVRPASAQDVPSAEALNAVVTSSSSALLHNVTVSDDAQMSLPRVQKPIKMGRSMIMPSLYASTALMQVLDVHSTLSGLRQGAVEGNPMMSGIVSHKAAFVAVKAGIAASTMLAVRQIAKRNKVAAVLTAVGINSLYAAVASHNYSVARAAARR